MNSQRHYHDDEERRKWQDPDAVLIDVGMKPGLTFVDVGCGNGFFTVPAARLVGDRGHVYAVDAREEAIARLRQRASVENLQNLTARVGEAESVVFCDACADIVFFGIVLHDFTNPVRVLSNAKKMLKPEGRLVDLDWKKEPMEIGPPEGIRFSEVQAGRLIESAGFKIVAVRNSGPYHYLVIAKRSPLGE